MARKVATPWRRAKYLLSALILTLPPWYYYQSQNPVFPDALASKSVNGFDFTPMPYDENPPYHHDGKYVKDFLVMVNKGDVSDIRQAYLNIGKSALPLDVLQKEELGILHGTRHGQHVHALAKADIRDSDKLWLTVQTWDGDTFQVDWQL